MLSNPVISAIAFVYLAGVEHGRPDHSVARATGPVAHGTWQVPVSSEWP